MSKSTFYETVNVTWPRTLSTSTLSETAKVGEASKLSERETRVCTNKLSDTENLNETSTLSMVARVYVSILM